MKSSGRLPLLCPDDAQDLLILCSEAGLVKTSGKSVKGAFQVVKTVGSLEPWKARLMIRLIEKYHPLSSNGDGSIMPSILPTIQADLCVIPGLECKLLNFQSKTTRWMVISRLFTRYSWSGKRLKHQCLSSNFR
jgi:hypothetical protein